MFKPIFVLLTWSLSPAFGQSIDSQSKRLAECEFTYTYTAHVMQLRNNEGAARNLLNRAAIITTANFMNNEVNGIIAGWKIKEFTLLRDPLKRKFDTGAIDPVAASGSCDLDALPVAVKVRSNEKMLWGQSFDELKQGFFEKLRASLGV